MNIFNEVKETRDNNGLYSLNKLRFYPMSGDYTIFPFKNYFGISKNLIIYPLDRKLNFMLFNDINFYYPSF